MASNIYTHKVVPYQAITNGATVSGCLQAPAGAHVSYQIDLYGSDPFGCIHTIRTTNNPPIEFSNYACRGNKPTVWHIEPGVQISGTSISSNNHQVVHISDLGSAAIGLFTTCTAGSGSIEITATVKI